MRLTEFARSVTESMGFSMGGGAPQAEVAAADRPEAATGTAWRTWSDRFAPPALRQDPLEDFVRKMSTSKSDSPRLGGRLMFAMDATASREETWSKACDIQAELFQTASGFGGIEVQLVYFRGLCECKWSTWSNDSATLAERMRAVRCQAGTTQIGRVLRHALKESGESRVRAVVYVGDCIEEDRHDLFELASELGLGGTAVFVFQEGDNAPAAEIFREVARRSGGAYARFDIASAWQLKELLTAAAVFAAGGRTALRDFSARRNGEVKLLTHQVDAWALS